VSWASALIGIVGKNPDIRSVADGVARRAARNLVSLYPSQLTLSSIPRRVRVPWAGARRAGTGECLAGRPIERADIAGFANIARGINGFICREDNKYV
jgi:hypothetical protein